METVNADELIREKRELQEQIDEKNEYLFNIGMGIQENNREIAEYEQDIERGKKNRELLIKLYYEAKEETFDDKSKLLAKLKKDVSEAEADIENAQAMILKLQECNKDNLANKEKLEKEVADLEEQLAGLHDGKTKNLTRAEDGTFFELIINGDSMEPKISKGDVVIARQQEDAETGDIVIVTINGDDVICRQLKKYKNGIALISTNPTYVPIYFSNEEIQNKPVRIIGKVVKLISPMITDLIRWKEAIQDE